MLNLLRRVKFPDELQTSAPLVKSRLIKHATDYNTIVSLAEEKAAGIVARAQKQASEIREEAQRQASLKVQSHLLRIQKLAEANREEIRRDTESLCKKLCLIMLERFFRSMSEKTRVEILIDSLVHSSFNARDLTIKCNPKTAAIVEQHLADKLRAQFALTKFKVVEDFAVKPQEIYLVTPHGSAIQASLENMLVLYGDEIKRLEFRHKKASGSAGAKGGLA